MRSFAVWYEEKEKNQERVKADIHVNLWSELPYNYCEGKCFFDFGIKVNDLRNVKNIKIYCPFELRNDSVKDLGKRISDNLLINAIFNENYSVTDGNAKHYIVNALDSKFIVYELSNVSEITIEKCDKDNDRSDDPAVDNHRQGTIITLETKNLIDNASDEAHGINSYYFRIRVMANKNNLNMITRKVENTNIFKEAIEGIELLDFRINDLRSCCNEVRDKINSSSNFWLKSIHFLVMRKINDSIISEGSSYSCRLLEKDVWDKYIDDLEDNVVAYHFKAKYKVCPTDTLVENRHVEVPVENFSFLVRFIYRRRTVFVVSVYLLVIVLISILSNYLSQCIFGD